MTTGTVRVEIHPPGTTLQHRGPLPLASATLTISGTTPTDPNALPTVASLVSGGLTGPCVAIVIPNLQAEDAVWCAVGKSPDPTREPRHLLSYANDGHPPITAITIGDNDRIAFAGVS